MLNVFLKKRYIDDEIKNMLKYLCLFYEMNKELFANNIKSQKEKKEIVKNIYGVLNYTNVPVLDCIKNYLKIQM